MQRLFGDMKELKQIKPKNIGTQFWW